jgi:hypothetical protein
MRDIYKIAYRNEKQEQEPQKTEKERATETKYQVGAACACGARDVIFFTFHHRQGCSSWRGRGLSLSLRAVIF